MSYEIVIERTKALEMELGKLGATGRGLHEKLTSIEASIPTQIAKKIRFVASVRNKVMHSDVKPEGDTLTAFTNVCGEVDGYFQELRVAKEKAEADAIRAANASHSASRDNSSSKKSDKDSLWKTGLAAAAAVAAWIWWNS
jgi:hypothetical protein